MARVKVCGITRVEDALFAADLGVDALGFVFYPKSPRFISPPLASEIIEKIPPFISTVGVFVDAPAREVQGIIEQCGLSAVQLHGQESPDFCREFEVMVVKAFRVKGSQLPPDLDQYSVDAILLDTYQAGVPGGTGSTFSWDVAVAAKRFGRVVLAGGLNCDNIEKALETVDPYGADVSSGVEATPGRKDARLLEGFVRKVKLGR